MTYTIEKLPNEPILLQTFNPGFSMIKDGPASIEDATRLLDSLDEPVFFINDMSHSTPSFEEVLHGSNMTARQTQLFKHPMIRETIIVTSSSLMTLAVKGMNSATFGNLQMKVTRTLDEALEYTRTQLG